MLEQDQPFIHHQLVRTVTANEVGLAEDLSVIESLPPDSDPEARARLILPALTKPIERAVQEATFGNEAWRAKMEEPLPYVSKYKPYKLRKLQRRRKWELNKLFTDAFIKPETLETEIEQLD